MEEEEDGEGTVAGTGGNRALAVTKQFVPDALQLYSVKIYNYDNGRFFTTSKIQMRVKMELRLRRKGEKKREVWSGIRLKYLLGR